MPDTTSLPMAEGGRASGGKTNWPVIIGVGGGGVLLLVLLMSSQKSGGSATTAAGTSINAALGTVQEQQLNLMGQVSQSQAEITKHVNANDSQLASEISAVNSNIAASVGAQGALTQAGLGFLINPQDPRVQQWLELYQSLNNQAASTIPPVPTF